MSPGPPAAVRRAALPALFLLSGATALVYEVSWTRRLVLLVGSTSGATAILLAAWMAGLALGARLGGPWADRSRRPLRLYAALEAGAAGLALLLPWMLDGIGAAGALTAAGREPLLFAAAALALLLPTTLLGATLPALSRAAVDDPAEAAPRVGFLYAANTLGAVGGALAAGFALVEALGVDGSARAAVAVNLLVAAVAWAMGGVPNPTRITVSTAGGNAAGSESGRNGSGSVRLAAAAAFAGGFVGLAAEVAWTRLLVFVLQGFTAAFAAMLGAFLLGSALGGAYFARRAGRSARPLALLGWIQVGAAVAWAFAVAEMDRHYAIVQWLQGAVAPFGSARANHDAVLLCAAFLVLGPPAFLAGGVFPVAVRAAAGGLDDLGERVGRLYAANTVGAVAGALAAGFVGIPLWGAGPTAAAVAAVSFLAGAATLWFEGSRPGAAPARRRIPLLAAAGLGVFALVALGRPDLPRILRSTVFLGARGRENELVDSREGRSGLASVVRNVRNGFTSLYTDEFLAASTEGRYRYMRMLGHIPAALCKDPPRNVLVMAFGTGTTAGSLSTHPSVERLDIVEISREVLDLASRFEGVNRGVVARAGKGGRPEVRLFVEDARRFVLASRDAYDVITLEPLLPYTPGAVHLYTTEFYALCRERLSPGGALCQWFPIHAMSTADFRSLAASFLEVFPEASLWFVEETAALVGTNGPQGMPVAEAARRLSAPGPKEDLEAGRLDDLAQWWSFRICGPGPLREWVKGAAAMDDEHPDIEFHPVPSGTLTTFLHDNLVTALDLREAERPGDHADFTGMAPPEAASFRARLAAAGDATAAYMDGRASEDLFSFHASHTRFATGKAEREAHERAASEALRTAVRRYGDALRANPRDRIVASRWRALEAARLLNEGRALLAQDRPGDAVEAYLAAIAADAPWNRDEGWTGLGRARLREGKPAAAREALEEAVHLYPGSRDAQALMGQALVALGRPGDARHWFEKAYEGGGGPSDEDTALFNARGAAMAAKGEEALNRVSAESTFTNAQQEIRRALTEALDDAGGPKGRRRDAAVARLRAAKAEERPILEELLAAPRRTALDAAAPPEERARALGLLGAATDPRMAEVARALAGSQDRALVLAAVDAAAEAKDPAALALLLDHRNGAPPAARASAADRLASLKDARSVDAVLAALEDPGVTVRTAAWAALFQLTGRKDFDPTAPEEDRHAAAARLREWWAGARAGWK